MQSKSSEGVGNLVAFAIYFALSFALHRGCLFTILANVYLHEVLDKWFERGVLPRLAGMAFILRYADDAVMVFSFLQDAMRVLNRST